MTSTLGKDLKISRVLSGLWQVADMERRGVLDPDEAAEELVPYVEAGLTTLDMADHYGSAEIIAGRLKKKVGNKSPVQLLTKWVPQPDVNSKDEVRAAVQHALQRIDVDTLDLLQFHAWNYAHPGWLDCLYWLQELKEEGLIMNLGLTNFDAAHLKMVLDSGIEVVSNQVSYSLIDQRASRALTEVCNHYGVGLLAYGTVAGGFLTERWLRVPEPDWEHLETWSQMKYGRFIQEAGGWEALQSLLEAVHQVAQTKGVSMANIASRFILGQPAVAGVIIGVRPGRTNHLSDNLRLFSLNLDESDRQILNEAMERLGQIPGDCGDEYRCPPFLTASGDLSHHLDKMPAPYESVIQPGGRIQALSGTIWEDLAGFSRAIRQGNRILVSGTTATHGNQVIGGNDPRSQMHFVIDKIEGAIQSLGGQLSDVIRTRVYVQHMEYWEPISRVHGERFGHIQPANTLIQANIIGDEYLVEVEAEAMLHD